MALALAWDWEMHTVRMRLGADGIQSQSRLQMPPPDFLLPYTSLLKHRGPGFSVCTTFTGARMFLLFLLGPLRPGPPARYHAFPVDLQSP